MFLLYCSSFLMCFFLLIIKFIIENICQKKILTTHYVFNKTFYLTVDFKTLGGLYKKNKLSIAKVKKL